MAELSYPCPEDPNDFTPNAKGEYCESCAKTIIDFTGMSNEQVQNTMAANPNGCGVFTEDQIQNRGSNELKSLFRVAFAMIFVLGININTVFAQSCGPEGNDHIKIEHVDQSGAWISGVVNNRYGSPVEGAKVKIYNNNEVYKMTTGADGAFALEDGICLTGEIEIFVDGKKLISETIALSEQKTPTQLTINMQRKYKKRRRRGRRVSGAYAGYFLLEPTQDGKKRKAKF